MIMPGKSIAEILEQLAAGKLDLLAAMARASALAHADDAIGNLTETRLDLDRTQRCGFAEFVYGAGKTVPQLRSIVAQLHDSGANVLVTRLDAEKAEPLLAAFPAASYEPMAKTLLWRDAARPLREGAVIAAAGTSDLPVAREAEQTLLACDCAATLLIDVGVAGLQRVLLQLDTLRRARAVIAVAGMEGALPSVLAGLVAAPVIAVPTSVGYGATLSGVTPMLAMLSSCGNGVTVVNIDNGFGAACAAARILNSAERLSCAQA